MFTSIPYDDGWEVYVDGQKKEIIKIADAFVGVDAGEGEHEIYLKYVPKGLRLGGIISIVFCLGYVLLIIYSIYSKKNKQNHLVGNKESA